MKRTVRSSKKAVKVEQESNRDIDAVLDMIDQRIYGLLIRSSEIHSKLDAREGKSSKVPPEFSFSILQSPAKPMSKSVEFSPVSRKSPVRSADRTSPVRQEKSPEPQPRSSPPSKAVSPKARKKDTVEIADLVATVQTLVKEVQEMKEEQRAMSDKICEMHTILMETHGKLDEGYEYDDI